MAVVSIANYREHFGKHKQPEPKPLAAVLAGIGVSSFPPPRLSLACALRRPREGVLAIEADLLPQFLAEFCGEGRSAFAVNTFRKQCRDKGPDAVRTEAERFIAEIAAGEEPDSRGAALTVRLVRLPMRTE